MYNITLICTRHKEIGKCNSEELYKIIDEYKPEVIFEELTPTTYDACYTYSSWGLTKITTVETDAIKMYQQHHNLINIPMLSVGMHDDFHLMHRTVDNLSYRDLAEKLDSLESVYGYQFLNSVECEQLFAKIKKLEKSMLQDDGIFSRAYQSVENYEYDMLENIYQYSAENEYNNALMFIGAAHRKSIIKKIKEYEKVSKMKLDWTFYK